MVESANWADSSRFYAWILFHQYYSAALRKKAVTQNMYFYSESMQTHSLFILSLQI